MSAVYAQNQDETLLDISEGMSSQNSTTAILPKLKQELGPEEWLKFSDSLLGFSIYYPSNWYLEEDPSFRKPTPVNGAFERRAILSNYPDSMFGEFMPLDNCVMQIFFKDTNGSQKIMSKTDSQTLLHTQFLTLSTGIQAYELSYNSELHNLYNHSELYIPYEGGILAFTFWTTNSHVSACNTIRQKVIDSINLQ